MIFLHFFWINSTNNTLRLKNNYFDNLLDVKNILVPSKIKAQPQQKKSFNPWRNMTEKHNPMNCLFDNFFQDLKL